MNLLAPHTYNPTGADVQRVIRVPDPAVGADWSVTVPGDRAWQPIAVRGALLLTAVGSPRAPKLVVDDGTTELVRIGNGETTVSAVTRRFTWADDLIRGTASQLGSSTMSPLPVMVLPGGHRLRTVTAALDVGDQWFDVRILVVERLAFGPAFLRLIGDTRP